MKKQENINHLIEEIIDSVDNIKRASPLPFLLTRIHARLKKPTINAWEKAVGFIGRPVIAIPALAMLVLINLGVIIFNSTGTFTTSTEQTSQPDDFSYTVTNIYDIENTEP